MVTLPMCWSFFVIWRSCTHSSERLKMRYKSLRNVAVHFKAFKCVKNAFLSSAVVTLLLFELRMCGAMTLISSRITSKRTVTHLEKDKTALADQYTSVTPLPSPFCRWCKFILYSIVMFFDFGRYSLPYMSAFRNSKVFLIVGRREDWLSWAKSP